MKNNLKDLYNHLLEHKVGLTTNSKIDSSIQTIDEFDEVWKKEHEEFMENEIYCYGRYCGIRKEITKLGKSRYGRE